MEFIGDPHAFENFRHTLMRQGFTDEEASATTNLGEKLKEALALKTNVTVTVEPVGPEENKSVSVLLMDYFKNVSHACLPKTGAELTAIIRKHRPTLSPNTVPAALTDLKKKGDIIRTPDGKYRLRQEGEAIQGALKAFQHEKKPRLKKDTVHESEPHVEIVSSQLSVPAVAGQSSGDQQIDEDLRALDDLLAAMAKADQVLRKYREIMHQWAKLKAMF